MENETLNSSEKELIRGLIYNELFYHDIIDSEYLYNLYNLFFKLDQKDDFSRVAKSDFEVWL